MNLIMSSYENNMTFKTSFCSVTIQTMFSDVCAMPPIAQLKTINCYLPYLGEREHITPLLFADIFFALEHVIFPQGSCICTEQPKFVQIIFKGELDF